MNTDLIFSSDPMKVFIANYVKHTFRYKDWVVSDNYVPNGGHPWWAQYSIIVTMADITDEKVLLEKRMEGQVIVNLISSLIPLCGLPSLNSPRYQDFNKGYSFIDYKNPPQGWGTNYNELKDKFEAVNKSKIKATLSFMGVCRYSTIDKSPLEELELMMNNYEDVRENIKYLIYLNYWLS